MSDQVITCAYCGYQYTNETPAAKHQLLTDHIKICEKHPLRAAELKIEKLKTALICLIGVETKEELDAMEIIIHSTPGPESDKVAAINAIDTLKSCT